MEFIHKPRAFMLELFDHGLNKCFWHKRILSLISRTARQFVKEGLVNWR
jgi:hypothetical protein